MRNDKLPAQNQLKGVLTVLDNRSGRPTVEMLAAIREMVTDALDVLQEPDPLKKRVGFILLSIQQSTEVKVRITNGKRITRVTVKDLTIYNWAMEQIHEIAGSLA